MQLFISMNKNRPSTRPLAMHSQELSRELRRQPICPYLLVEQEQRKSWYCRRYEVIRELLLRGIDN